MLRNKIVVDAFSDDVFVDAIASKIDVAMAPPIAGRSPIGASRDADPDPEGDDRDFEAPLLLKVGEAATLCGIGRSTAYELMRSGAWPTVRVGKRSVRVPRAALLDWIQREVERGGAYEYNW